VNVQGALLLWLRQYWHTEVLDLDGQSLSMPVLSKVLHNLHIDRLRSRKPQTSLHSSGMHAYASNIDSR